jgi:hypothetical protein
MDSAKPASNSPKPTTDSTKSKPPPPPPRTLRQALIDGPSYGLLEIQYLEYSIADAPNAKALKGICKGANNLGLAASYLDDGRVDRLAICAMERCLVFRFSYPKSPNRSRGQSSPPLSQTDKESDAKWAENLQKLVLCRDSGTLVGFDLAPLAMSLYRSRDIRVKNAIDIQSFITLQDPEDDNRRPLHSIKMLLGDHDPEVTVREENITYTFRNATEKAGVTLPYLVQRAWIAQFLYNHSNGASALDEVKKIDTALISNTVCILVHFGYY